MSPLLILSILSPLVPIITGIKKRFTLLWLYVITGFCFDVTVTTQKRLLHVDKDPASNLFVLVEFLLISFIYKGRIIKNATFFYLFTFALSAFFIINTLLKTIYDFNAFAASFFTFTYMVYAIFGFYHILRQQSVLFLEKSSFFWTNTAFLMYAAGNLLLFLFRDYLLAVNKELFLALWGSMFLTLNIAKNILIAFAIYNQKQQTGESADLI